MNSIKLLEELTLLSGAPGYEHEVRNYMQEKLSNLSDTIIKDNLGSIYAVKKSKNPNAPKIMFAGHMDEVGFMITGHNEYGLLRFIPLGGWWNQTMLSQKLTIVTRDKTYRGIISSISPHLLKEEQRAKPMDINNMLIDCGFNSKEEAEKHVPIGSFAVPFTQFEQLSETRYVSKAFDNRYGCAMAIDVLEALKDVELDCHLYIGATVQEEVGLRGAITSSSLIKPDFFIAADCSPARDTSGDKSELGRLGDGFLVRVHDRSTIMAPNIRKYLIKTATENEIKFQYYTSPGGTDAGAVHISNDGVLSAVIGIASRGIHSHTSIIDYRDYESAKKMIIAMIKDLNADVIESIKND